MWVGLSLLLSRFCFSFSPDSLIFLFGSVFGLCALRVTEEHSDDPTGTAFCGGRPRARGFHFMYKHECHFFQVLFEFNPGGEMAETTQIVAEHFARLVRS